LEQKRGENQPKKGINVIKTNVFGIKSKEKYKYVTDAKLHGINHALHVKK
jgi:hypothetical protein